MANEEIIEVVDTPVGEVIEEISVPQLEYDLIKPDIVELTLKSQSYLNTIFSDPANKLTYYAVVDSYFNQLAFSNKVVDADYILSHMPKQMKPNSNEYNITVKFKFNIDTLEVVAEDADVIDVAVVSSNIIPIFETFKAKYPENTTIDEPVINEFTIETSTRVVNCHIVMKCKLA